MTRLLTSLLLLSLAFASHAQEPPTHSAPLPPEAETSPDLALEPPSETTAPELPEPDPEIPATEPEFRPTDPDPTAHDHEPRSTARVPTESAHAHDHEPRPTTLDPTEPAHAHDHEPRPTASARTETDPPLPIKIELTQAPAVPSQPTIIQSPPSGNLAEHLLPRPPRADLFRALMLLLATLASVGLGNLAERPLARLASQGLLPSALKLLVVVFRSGALLLAFLGLLHLVPQAWSPAVAYVLVGTALALGWSVREVVQDVVVGLIFTLEHSFQAGQRIRMEGTTGTLQRMTFRVTWLRTDEGADIAVPNRKLTSVTMELDPAPYTPVSVLLLVPPCQSSVEARNTIRELVLLNPYLAPDSDPQVHRQADDPQRWLVKARLLDVRYADRFRGTMVDLVEEVFGPPSGPCGCEEKGPRGPA
jgi:hypothetical protein